MSSPAKLSGRVWAIKTVALDFINIMLRDKRLRHDYEPHRQVHTPIHVRLRGTYRDLNFPTRRKINDE